MRKAVRVFSATASLTILLAGALACGKGGKKNQVNIGYVYAMANAPVIIAEKKGFFKKHGVKANLLKFTSGPVLYKAIVSGDLDIAYVGFPPAYHWRAKGLPITVVARVNYGQHVILVKKDSGIKSLQDLKGKKIAGAQVDAAFIWEPLTTRYVAS